MASAVQELIRDSQLEQLSELEFRGSAKHEPGERTYGGLFMAQAVAAAQQTVAENYIIHSQQCYFFKSGANDLPIDYYVSKLRDGKSYCFRSVKAFQRDELLFEASMSFQLPEDGPSHQTAQLPSVPHFEHLISDKIRFKSIMPENSFSWPILFYHVDPVDLLKPKSAEPVNYIWCKTNGISGASDRVNKQLLAYAIDNPMLQTALRPHGLSYLDPQVMVGTISHATWFYNQVNLDYGILFEVHSEYAGNGRATSRTNVFDHKGNLVAAAVQEGFLRAPSDS